MYEPLGIPQAAGGGGAVAEHVGNQLQDFFNAHEVTAPLRLLLRTQSGRAKKRCELCWDDKADGTMCENNHFICRDDCFAEYVHSLCAEPYRLRLLKGQICCPVQNCGAAHFGHEVVRAGLLGHEVIIEEYARACDDLIEANGDEFLRDVDPANESDEMRVVNLLCDSMNFRCPYKRCRAYLDPSPDGCCSIKCLACGGNFCWLCLKPSGSSSEQSHAHVLSCPESPAPDNLFISQLELKSVHRKRRLEQIRLALLSSEGNAWRTSKTVVAAISKLDATVVKERDLTAEMILDDKEVRITTANNPMSAAPDGEQGHPRDVFVSLVSTANYLLGCYVAYNSPRAATFLASGGYFLSSLNWLVTLEGYVLIIVAIISHLFEPRLYPLLVLYGVLYYWVLGSAVNVLVSWISYFFGLILSLSIVAASVVGIAATFGGHQGMMAATVATTATIFVVLLLIFEIPALVGYFTLAELTNTALVDNFSPSLTFARLCALYAVVLSGVGILKWDYHRFRMRYPPWATALVTALRPAESWIIIIFINILCIDAITRIDWNTP